METLRYAICVLASTLLLVGAVCGQEKAEDQKDALMVNAVLADGWQVNGQLDGRTSQTHLWLRNERVGINLAVSYAWSSVEEVWIGDVQIGRDQVVAKASVDRKRHPLPKSQGGSRSTRVIGQLDGTLPGRPPQTSRVGPPNSPPALPRRSRVVTLEIHVELANLDDDEDLDGYLLRILPLDRDRNIRPVTGSLSVQLQGVRAILGLARSDTANLEQWSLRVRSADFGQWGAVYELPFRNFSPERRPDLSPLAKINVQLGVSGSGRFRATEAVAIRRLRTSLSPFGSVRGRSVRGR